MLNLPKHLSALSHDVLNLVHGEVLFMPGAPIEAVFLVDRGGVSIFSGRGERLESRTGPQRLIGLRDILAGGHWRGLGVAEGLTRLRVFDARHILAAVENTPAPHRDLLHMLAAA